MTSFRDLAGRLLLLILLLGVGQILGGCASGRWGQRMPVGAALSVGAALEKDQYPLWMILPTDQVVVAVLEGVGEWEGDTLEWSWRDPEGTIVQRERRKLYGDGDRTLLTFSSSTMASRQGWWGVLVRGPGGLVLEKQFLLVADKDRWWAVHAEYGHDRVRALSTLCARGEFSFLIERFPHSWTAEERQSLESCFDKNLDAVVPSLAAALESSPEDESLLALAYRVKKKLIQRFKATDFPDGLLKQLSLLATRWDAGLFATLLANPAREVRVGGVDLIGRTKSAEAVLFLEQGLTDVDAEVRLKSVEVLEQIPDPAAVEVLQRGLSLERDPLLRTRLQGAVANRKGVPQ